MGDQLEHINSRHMVSIAVGELLSCLVINQTSLSENKQNVNDLFMIDVKRYEKELITGTSCGQ